MRWAALLRPLARLPAWLYRRRLGWLLGQRFLLLTHRGRRSGQPRHTVLEVVHRDRKANLYVVASGRGDQAHWFLNIMNTPEVEITVGTRRFSATAARLELVEATAVLLAYGRRHRLAFCLLTRLIAGTHVRATHADCELLARRLPLVALYTHGMPGQPRGTQQLTWWQRGLVSRRLATGSPRRDCPSSPSLLSGRAQARRARLAPRRPRPPTPAHFVKAASRASLPASNSTSPARNT